MGGSNYGTDQQRVTSAILAYSLSWNNEAIRSVRPRLARTRFADEAMRWQGVSQRGAWQEVYAYTPRKRGAALPPANRLVELHGLMGGIGEQASLCWTAEQDAQRFVQTGRGRTVEHQRLVLRAHAELAGHFLLGAAHSIGNLAIRLALVNDSAGARLNMLRPKASGFPPGADDRSSWLTLHDARVLLQRALEHVDNVFLVRIGAATAALDQDLRFRALDDRRGMDYHRRRPQSVPHASPRQGTNRVEGGTRSISMVAASVEPDANENVVHATVVGAMPALRTAMREIRSLIPRALRAEGIHYSATL